MFKELNANIGKEFRRICYMYKGTHHGSGVKLVNWVLVRKSQIPFEVFDDNGSIICDYDHVMGTHGSPSSVNY